MFGLLALVFLLQPVEVPAYEGAISDAIAKRIEEKALGRINELGDTIREMREERTTILESIKQFREEREGVLSKLQELRQSLADASTKWTPIQNLVDRLTALLWKLIWFVCILAGFVVIVGGLGLYLYVRLKKTIIDKLGVG
jgi:ABC-type multidrug transport system fused ATPase/permease subunit